MPYLNSWRRALVAMALLLSAASGLHAQEASVASGTLRGDVDGDGRVTRADAEAVRAYLVRGTLPAGRSILPAGDANGDGRVTAADAALISRFAAGLDVSRFPVGRPVGEGRGGGEGAPTSSSALQTGDQFCEADVEAGTVTCREVLAGGTAVQNVIVGDPYVSYLTGTAHSRGNPANEDTTIYTVAIKNNTPQPLGTTDGSTLAADGIRLFVTDTPQAVKKIAGSGPSPMTIRLEGSDGRATFTNQDGTVTYTNRMYFQYNQVLAPNATSAVDTLRLIYSANVQKFTFAYRVSAPVQFEHGWITISPATAPLIGPAQTTTLTASVFNQVGASMADPVTWSSSNPAVATVDGSGVVTGVAGGTVTITAMSSVNGARVGTRIVQVIGANDETFGTTVLGNVAIGSSGFSVIANDSLHGAATIADAGDPVTTAQGGTATVAADGTFTYDPPAGYEGSDSFDYTIESGTASATGTVSLTVAGMVWFVDANAASECTTHCGRKSSPFKALSTFNTANQAGGSNNPADNEPVFLYEGTYTGPVTLRAGQKLIGQDATGALATLAGVTVPTGSTLPSTASGNAEKVTVAGADGINLAQNNAVYGLTLATTAGEAIGGSNFGTLTLAAAAGADVTIASSGQAIGLNTGTLSGGFASVTSTGGTNNVSLVGVGTSGTASLGGGALSGASGDAFVVTNGTGSFSYSGTVTNTAARTVNVSGKTGGTVAFSGAINPGVVGSAGGVSLTTNTGATIAFSAPLTINSATAAGFTATGGGTVSLTGSGSTITTTTGTALTLNGVGIGAGGVNLASVSANGATNGIVLADLLAGSVGVQVSGGTIQNTTGAAVSLSNLTNVTGQVQLTGMALSRASGTGTVVSGSSFGTLNLGSTTVGATGGPTALSLTTGTLSGTITSINASGVASGTHAVALTGVGGTYTVSGGTVNGTTNGDALRVSGGNAVATWNGTLAATASGGRSVNIASTTAGGSYTFGNTVTAGNASAGVSITGNAGSVTMPGLTLGTSGARFSATPLTLQMGAGNVSLGAVSIFTTGAAATGLAMASAAGAGTLTVTSGTIDAAGSPAVNIAPVSGTQPVSISLTTVNANGGASGVVLNGTSGAFTVTGTGSTAGSGGTIQNTTGNAISLTSASNVQMSLMSLQPDASGWMGTNLSGTNSLSRSTVDYLNTAPGGAFAFRVANTNTNATVTLDGTTFQNKMDGTTAVSISALGNSVITFNAIDSNTGDAFPSRYRNLFGSGIVVGSGDDVGSTALVTANVSNSTFQDAPSNGLNNLELGVTQNATLVPNVTNNVFDKVALPLATVGVINVNATVMGRVGSNAASGVISGNTISNIRSGAGPTFAFDPAGTNGYVGMRIAIDNDAGGVNHKLQILNNSVTNVARQGLLVSARGAANNVNVLVQGNTIGTAAAPVGTASARRGVEIEAQTTATLKVQVSNNPSIVGGTSAANSALAIRAGVNTGATSVVHATVTGNTIGNPNAGTNDGRFRAETVSGNNGTMCLDLRNNALESAAKEFQTNNNGGTFNRNASGNTGTITTIGVVGAVGSCTLPSF